MIDESAVGRTGASYTVPVESGKVLEFARAVHGEDLVSDGDVVIPGTFLTTAVFFWQTPEANPLKPGDLDAQRVLHGEQEFVFHGPPPRPPATLRAQARISNVRRRDGKRGGTMTLVDITTEFRDEAGVLVAESRSTAVETAQPPVEKSEN